MNEDDYVLLAYCKETEEWYPCINGNVMESLGGFIDPITAGIIVQEIENEIKRNRR